MKDPLPKLLLFISISAATGVSLMVVWQLVFQTKERSLYQWGIATLDEQTVQIICGKATFYYRSHQNPDVSMPISYREQAVDLNHCANLKPPVERFSFLVSPHQKCDQIDAMKWQCQGAFVKALYNRQHNQKHRQ